MKKTFKYPLYPTKKQTATLLGRVLSQMQRHLTPPNQYIFAARVFYLEFN